MFNSKSHETPREPSKIETMRGGISDLIEGSRETNNGVYNLNNPQLRSSRQRLKRKLRRMIS